MKVLNWKPWSRTGLGILGMLLAIQLVPYGRDYTKPPVMGEPAWDAPETRALAKQACFDCHSNEMEWSAYSWVAPGSWLVQYDVSEGRAALNFSEWQRPQKEANEAAEEIVEREMPPRISGLMHSHGRLSGARRDRLPRGLERTSGGTGAGRRVPAGTR